MAQAKEDVNRDPVFEDWKPSIIDVLIYFELI